jgi:hypothetical protein
MILYSTVGADDFMVVRLRVGDGSWFREKDYWKVFLFDDVVVAWGKKLEKVGIVREADLQWARKQWRRLGRSARKEKIKARGWDTMVGRGDCVFKGFRSTKN